MQYQMSFERLVNYDAGESGITINTTLKFTDKSVSFPAKIDTGASFCIFERRIGEELGLKIENGFFQRVGTPIGTFVVFGFILNLKVEEMEFDSMVYFPEDENLRRNVLGRHGWLELVKIGVIDYAGKLYLSRYLD